MSDPRDPNAEARLAERTQRYTEAMQDLDTPDVAHLSAEEIRRCTMCDDDGYRPQGVVCDHVDRTGIGRRQREQIRQILAKKRHNAHPGGFQ